MATDSVPTGLGRIGQDWREPLNPAKERHLVDFDPSLGEELLEIPVGQSVAQVPPPGEKDDVGREPEPGERQGGLLDVRRGTATLHADSHVQAGRRHETRSTSSRSRSMQQYRLIHAYRLAA